MEKVFILGKMEEGMMVNISLIKNMDMEFINGRMAEVNIINKVIFKIRI